MPEILVDDQSYKLAEHFLRGEVEDSMDNRTALAVVIQQAVEDWFREQGDG